MGVQQKNVPIVWNYLKGQGLNDSAAAGVMGNLEWESGLNPEITNGIGAYGLAQWLGPRKSAVLSYENSHSNESHLQSELGYLWYEIASGTEGVTPQSLNAAGSPTAAAALFNNKFERPGQDGSLGGREQMANQVYSQMKGQGSQGSIQGAGAAPLPGTIDLSASSSSAPTTQGANSTPSGSDAIQIIDKSMSLQDFNILHPGQSLAQDAEAIALRTVLVIIGLILLIFGLVAIVEKATGGAVPVPV